MDFAQALAAIRTRLEASFTGLPLVWANTGEDPAETYPDGWCYVEFSADMGEQKSFGATTNIHRDTIRVVAYCMVPRGELPGRVEQIATDFRAALKNNSVPGVRFVKRSILSGQPAGKSSRWFGIPVIIEGDYDRLEARV